MNPEQKIWYMTMELQILRAHLAYLEFYIRVLKARSLLEYKKKEIKCQDGTIFSLE